MITLKTLRIMTKRKTPAELAAGKPRKRVAFYAPKDAAIKCNDPQRTLGIQWPLTPHSRITRDASTLPFLRLPPKIRNKIYSELQGDRLIHIEHTSGAAFPAISPYRRPRSSAWRRVVCQADCSEIQEDQKTTYSDLDGDGEEFVWLGPHSKCDDSVGSLYGDREMLHLQILRSCRQMYIEANQIFWSSNTFSFDESTALKCFMGHEPSYESVR